MAIRIDNEKLQELVSYLTIKLPYTIRILGLAQNVLCGRVDGQRFVVDRWPQPSAIVVKTVPGKFDRPRMEVWGDSAADLCRLLSATSDWTETFTFTGVNIDFKEALAETAPGSLDFSPNDQYLYVWPPDNPVPEISELPDGMRLGRLVPEHAVQMTANWRYAYDAAATERMLRRLIQSMSSSAITDRSGRLLGYCTQYHYGAFGFLNVDPEYRRRGFGRLLLADMLRQVRSAGVRPYLVVEDYNTAGQTLVTSDSVGFQRTDYTVRFAKYSAASK